MANRKRLKMYSLHGDVQPSHVKFIRDVLLQKIPSPQPLRPRLCIKVDELSNATGTDPVDLGDRRAQVVDDGQNGESKTSIFWGMLKLSGVQQRIDTYTPVN